MGVKRKKAQDCSQNTASRQKKEKEKKKRGGGEEREKNVSKNLMTTFSFPSHFTMVVVSFGGRCHVTLSFAHDEMDRFRTSCLVSIDRACTSLTRIWPLFALICVKLRSTKERHSLG